MIKYEEVSHRDMREGGKEGRGGMLRATYFKNSYYKSFSSASLSLLHRVLRLKFNLT